MKQFEIVEIGRTQASGGMFVETQRVIARRTEDELRPEVIEGLKVGQYRELGGNIEVWRSR